MHKQLALSPIKAEMQLTVDDRCQPLALQDGMYCAFDMHQIAPSINNILIYKEKLRLRWYGLPSRINAIMSPFSHFLHELRMRHGVRQIDLAERIGYEQSYISALEAGAKGPPTQEFVDRLQSVLALSEEEARHLKAAADASQRKLVIEADMPQDVYWLLSRLRASL